MKRCFKCGHNKPLDDFYRHSMMADGHLGKCKACTKLDMRVARVMNPLVREYDRARATSPIRKLLSARIVREWRQKYPERQRAHNIAARARLTAPTLCEGCGLRKRVEKHHPDYRQALVVMWLCKPCHAIADKIRRKLEKLSA